MNLFTQTSQRSTDQHELARRAAAESALGSAASSLEHAATTIERLAVLDGFTYAATEDGDMLGQIQQLSDRVLALQVQLRTENHR